MQKLDRETLHSLEEYSAIRDEFRRKVMEHKQPRRVALNDHANLYFEDFLTMQYQVQEMLRAERIFEADGIMDEIDTYNPMIPDGSNWKSTFMVEYEDVAERRARLAELVGVEDRIYMQVDGMDRVYAIADEDLERATPDKTSAVHFLRFEFDGGMVASLKHGAALSAGIDHPHYRHETGALPDEIRDALVADFA